MCSCNKAYRNFHQGYILSRVLDMKWKEVIVVVFKKYLTILTLAQPL